MPLVDELPLIVLAGIAQHLSLGDFIRLRSCARNLRHRLLAADSRLGGLSLICAELQRIFTLPSTLQKYEELEGTYDALPGFLFISPSRCGPGCEILFEVDNDIFIDESDETFSEKSGQCTIKVMDFADSSKSIYLTGTIRLSSWRQFLDGMSFFDYAIYMHTADGRYVQVYRGEHGDYDEVHSALPAIASLLHTTHEELAALLTSAFSFENDIYTDGTQSINWTQLQPDLPNKPEDVAIEYDLQQKRLTPCLRQALALVRPHWNPRARDSDRSLCQWIRQKIDLKRARSNLFFFPGVFQALHDNWRLFHDTNLPDGINPEGFVMDWIKSNIVFTSFTCDKIASEENWPHSVEQQEISFNVNGPENQVTVKRLLCCPNRRGGWNELVGWSQGHGTLFEVVANSTNLTLVLGAHSVAFRDIVGCSEMWPNADVFMLAIAALALSCVVWPSTIAFDLRRVYIAGENETLLQIPLEPPLRVQQAPMATGDVL
ncbi:uncharacterized protein EV422DRAFT_12169 [Fimicolochytrium jonesii]|uniref:uncharacterized protein n=1 Tax=Fimicolochytrium jonesii TaxID=1396493 RepID=UPI0022FEA36A|nr:uncharacterized protein EV422DRAFT_12169 [Fimicolochytrium jonesii]KAI8826818.1 hypothetical protein EV422DRAFT_12169 [Fimicolochytrium jonesii]